MLESLIVMIGGSFGAVCRFAVSSFIKKAFSTEFPISTLFINVAGCFLMGGLFASHPGNLDQLLLGTGFLGGFTTFSAFEMENVTLLCGTCFLQFPHIEEGLQQVQRPKAPLGIGIIHDVGTLAPPNQISPDQWSTET